MTWLSKAQGEGAGLGEQETSPVVAGTNGSKTWEWSWPLGRYGGDSEEAINAY